MKKKVIYIFCILLLDFYLLNSQNIPTIQTLNNPSPGYYFLEVNEQNIFQLFDNYSKFVFPKETISKKRKKILENGLIAELAFNKYFIYNQNIELIDSVINPTNYTIDMHDLVALKNGHYMMLLDRQIQMDMSKIVDGGKPNAAIVDNVLVETDGKGNIFWTWSAFEHLQITDATPAVDLTMNIIDLFHINSIFEDNNGNILISIRHFDEIALIDKQTKQFIWRFGGQYSKNNQFTILNDKINGFVGFSHQHTASILPNGNILMFDNGNLKPVQYSRAVEYSLNHQNKTATKVWEYRNNPDIYTFVMGSAYRLENGNTLICWGWSKNAFTEVRPDNTITAEATFEQTNAIYRVQKTNLRQKYISLTVNSTGTFDYNNIENVTGIKIKVESFSGNGGKTHIQKHFYLPHRADYSDNNFLSVLPYRWVFSNDGGFSSISGELQLDPKTITEINFPQSIVFYHREGEDNGVFTKLQTSYDIINNLINARFIGFGEFVIAKKKIPGPILLSPSNESRGIQTYGTFTWAKFPFAQKYQLQVATNLSYSQNIIDTIVVGKEQFNYFKLDYSTIYFWRVRAISGDDTTEWSPTFTFRTNIAPPKIIYPEFNSIGFKLSDKFLWDIVQDAKSYHFQISTEKLFQNLIINKYDIIDNYTQTENLDFNTTYFCRVRSISTPDTSEWSNYVQFTTNLPSPTLIYPNNDAININLTVQLKWSKVNSSEGYILELTDKSTFINEFTKRMVILDTAVTVYNLDYNTTYHWRVLAYRNNDTSNWSEIFAFTTKPHDTLLNEIQPPKILYPKDNQFAIPISGQFRWSKVVNSNGYKISLSNSDNSQLKEYSIDDSNATSISYEDLEFNVKYILRVKSIMGLYQSNWSSPVTFTTELAAPTIIYPSNNENEVPQEGAILFKVDAESFFFHIQIATDNEFANLIIDKKNITENKFEYILAPNATYYTRIRHYNDSNTSSWSNPIKFSTTSNNSVQQFNTNKINTVLILDNNEIILEIENYQSFDFVKIYNSIGQVVYESRINNFRTIIKTIEFMKGAYFLILVSEKGFLYNQKFNLLIFE